MAVVYTFRVGDAVWGKVKGFSAWPGKIVLPPDGLKRPAMKKMMHCVEFFGTHDFAWILEPDVKPYLEFRETLTLNKKSSPFLKAIEEIDQFVTLRGDTVQKPIAPDSVSSGDAEELENSMQDTEFDALFGGDCTASNSKKTPKIKLKKETNHDGTNSTAKKPKKQLKRTQDNGHHALEDVESAIPTKKKSISAVTNFLDRPMFELECAPSPSRDIGKTSQKLMDKNIEPSRLNFGFLGLGIMGSGIVKNLLNSGHSVTVWNRTAEKRDEFVKAGAREALTPGDVIAESDITFSCISDPQAVKDMVFGNCGVLSEINTTKGYVEMTGIDPDTSQDIAEAISLKGGRYLEAQVQGSKDQSQDGSLVVLVAGDKSLFDDAQSCFQAMGKYSYHLGEVGNASRMNLVLQLMSGVALAGLAEGMALADRAGLQQKDILEVLQLTGLACPMMIEKGKAILEGSFPPNHPLQHMQKDLKLSLNMGDQLEQPLPLTATANEVFKHAKRLGYGEHDTSAVYIRARF